MHKAMNGVQRAGYGKGRWARVWPQGSRWPRWSGRCSFIRFTTPLVPLDSDAQTPQTMCFTYTIAPTTAPYWLFNDLGN